MTLEINQPSTTATKTNMSKKTKYFFDTEFIEDGKTIDLISIGIACEDGRVYYAQNQECKFTKANEWVWRNVFPHLDHFNMRGGGVRSCQQHKGMSHEPLTGKCVIGGNTYCPWRYHWEIRNEVREFMDVEKYGKPEIWGYYADYDWVAFCQLFGAMIELPKGFPMFCMDLKQLCVSVGDPELPKLESISGVEHHALHDTMEIKFRHHWLQELMRTTKIPLDVTPPPVA